MHLNVPTSPTYNGVPSANGLQKEKVQSRFYFSSHGLTARCFEMQGPLFKRRKLFADSSLYFFIDQLALGVKGATKSVHKNLRLIERKKDLNTQQPGEDGTEPERSPCGGETMIAKAFPESKRFSGSRRPNRGHFLALGRSSNCILDTR